MVEGVVVLLPGRRLAYAVQVLQMGLCIAFPHVGVMSNHYCAAFFDEVIEHWEGGI